MKAKIITPHQRPKAIQFTKQGLDKVQAEFDRLTADRPNILARLQTAREMGDLSENGAYHAAKFELGNTDRALRRLSYQLRFGEVVASKGNGIIDFGCRVTLDNSGKKMQFELVNGFESNPQEKKLSMMSPIGKAVMGKRVGDTVVVEAPAGKLLFTIIAVE